MKEPSAFVDSVRKPPAETNWERVAPSLLLSMVPGVGPLLRRDLLDRFETSEAVLAAAPADLRQVPGLGPKLARAITTARDEIDVQAEIRRCREAGVALIAEGDPDYPPLLAEIHDPPAVLFVRGQLLPQDAMAISIVGTRHATNYGRRQTQQLASSLARAGLTIVSGLARGIDGVAHRAALEAGGRTIAVLGGGVLNIYPPEHQQLADEIICNGAVLSENATTARPSRGAFPRRNRIVTGLSHGVLVVEAGDRSGALISARHAMEQGREVFAVPGRVDSRTSHGCHRLIRDGAKLVETADDVLEELGPLFQSVTDTAGREVRHPGELQLNDQERAVLDAVGVDPTTVDAVIVGSGLPIHRVLSTLSVLEMRHLIRRLSGTQVVRA